MVVGSSNGHWDMSESSDNSSDICMNLFLIYCRNQGFTAFDRKDYVQVYFGVGVGHIPDVVLVLSPLRGSLGEGRVFIMTRSAGRYAVLERAYGL